MNAADAVAEGWEIRRVRVRLLPWRPRWRTRKDDTAVDALTCGFPDFDDPISVVLGGLVLLLLLPALLLLALGALLLSAELAVLLALLPLVWAWQVLGLLPWTLVLIGTDGTRRFEQVRGTAAFLARRRQLRDLRN